MSDHSLFDPRESRGRPGPFIPDTAYRSAEALLGESFARQREWRGICAAAHRRLSLACRGCIADEAYRILCHLLTAARRGGETDLLFGVLYQRVPIASYADLATWCRAQESVLPIYESHYGPQAYHVVLRRPGECAEINEFEVIRLAIPLLREYSNVVPIAEKIGPLEVRFGKGPRMKPPAHVGPEPLRRVVQDAWQFVRVMRGVDRPPEPESVPDVPTALRAFDAVIRWCELQAPPAKPAVTVGTAKPAKRKKRSSERGDGRDKLIAALTKHHDYADGGCLNLEPIGNNALARLADVSTSTASTFFEKEFSGHGRYRALCRDQHRLIAALKTLNGEFRPRDFLLAQKPDELPDRD